MKPQDRSPEVRLAEGAEPEVYLLTREDSRWAFSRRDVMGAAVAAAVAATKAAQAQSCGRLLAHADRVNALVYAQDGRSLISCGEDKTVKFWKLPEAAHYKTITGSDGFEDLALSPDGRVLAAGYSGGVLLQSLTDETAPRELRAPGGALALAFSPDGRFVVLTGYGSTVGIWAVREGILVRTLTMDDKGTFTASEDLAISPDGELLAVGDISRRVYLWSLPEGRRVSSFYADPDLRCVAFSPDGQFLITAGKGIRLWSLPGTSLVATFAEDRQVRDMAISPDGSFLAVGSDGQPVQLWSLPGRTLIRTVTGQGGGSILALSPDGRQLAWGADNKTIGLISLTDGTPLDKCFVDLAATPSSGQGIKYTLGGVTYTLPCGAAIPAGAVCTCNCVPGSYSGGGGGGGGGGICTCIPVVYRYPN